MDEYVDGDLAELPDPVLGYLEALPQPDPTNFPWTRRWDPRIYELFGISKGPRDDEPEGEQVKNMEWPETQKRWAVDRKNILLHQEPADGTMHRVPTFPYWFNPKDRPPFRFDGQPLFISVDIRRKVLAVNSSPVLYEFGYSVLDTRHLFDDKARTLRMAPGDRGTNYARKIQSEHIILDDGIYTGFEEVSTHYAFGESSRMTTAKFANWVKQRWTNWKRHGLKDKSEPDRNIVLLMFSGGDYPHPGADPDTLPRTLLRLDSRWITESRAVWALDHQEVARDVLHFCGRQKFHAHLLRLQNLCNRLGMQTELEGYNLTSNAGNRAAFIMQAFLAMVLLHPEQHGNLVQDGFAARPDSLPSFFDVPRIDKHKPMLGSYLKKNMPSLDLDEL